MTVKRMNRRQFVMSVTAAATAASAATASASTISIPDYVRPSALGLGGRTAPSDRFVMGFIGTGGKGQHNLGVFLDSADVQVVAVNDVETSHRESARNAVNERYKNKDCGCFADYGEMLDSAKFDAVGVSTPDHWHALASIAALNHNAHVYCEKPLANSVAEGRAMVAAAKRSNRLIQCGSQERSNDSVRLACEQVRNGKIGKVHTVEINLPTDESHHLKVMAQTTMAEVRNVPGGFDYDSWLGYTPWREYRPFMADEPDRGCHFWWRFNVLYGGGEMTDRGAHIIDLAQLGLGMDDTGPVSITAKGKRAQGGGFDAFFDFSFENVYSNGTKLIGSTNAPRGLKFIGEGGWIMVHIHGGRLEASDPRLIDPADAKDNKISIGRSPGHHQNFLDCIKSGKQPVASGEIGHRTGSICHLNNIAMKLGRPLKWNPEAEKFINDDEANKLLAPPKRAWLGGANSLPF